MADAGEEDERKADALENGRPGSVRQRCNRHLPPTSTPGTLRFGLAPFEKPEKPQRPQKPQEPQEPQKPFIGTRHRTPVWSMAAVLGR